MAGIAELLTAAAQPGGDPWAGSLTVPYSDIPAIPARYLWPDVIPFRTPVMLAAPGGTGKGLAIAAIIALITTGQPFPGQQQGREPGAVIIVAPEDDANEDLSFRLSAAGADLSLVHDFTYLPDGTAFTLPANLPELRQAIAQVSESGPPVMLVALDPLLAMVTSSLSSATAARKVVEPLQELTRDAGIAMIISHHAVKSGAVAGSKAITDAMRLVWMVSVARDDASARVMTIGKSNRKNGLTIRYRIEGQGAGVHAVFDAPRDDTAPGSRAARLRLIASGVASRQLSAGEALAALEQLPPEEGREGQPSAPVTGTPDVPDVESRPQGPRLP